jgi:hypothetical protein
MRRAIAPGRAAASGDKPLGLEQPEQLRTGTVAGSCSSGTVPRAAITHRSCATSVAGRGLRCCTLLAPFPIPRDRTSKRTAFDGAALGGRKKRRPRYPGTAPFKLVRAAN